MIKGWCRGGAVLVQVGAIYFFYLFIYLYLYLSSISFLFSIYKSLSVFYRVYPSFWRLSGLQKNGNRTLKTRVFTSANVSY